MKKGVLTELLCSFFESSNNIPAKDVAGHKRKASNQIEEKAPSYESINRYFHKPERGAGSLANERTDKLRVQTGFSQTQLWHVWQRCKEIDKE